MVIKKFFLLILFVLFTGLSSASVGVRPGTYEIDFEPGVERVFTFSFVGDSLSDFEVYAEGDLAKYVTLSVDEITGSGDVRVLLELPEKVDVPGQHIIYIGAKEYVDDDSLAVYANIRGRIIINVPYPGTYVTMGFNAEDANTGEDVKMVSTIESLGTDDVTMKGKINIYDERGKFLESFTTGEYTLSFREKEIVEFFLDTKPYVSGNFEAESVFEYNGEEIIQKDKFRLGELYIDVIDATRKVNRDSLNKFDVTIESKWNDEIDNVHAEIIVLGYDRRIETPSVDIKGFGIANLSGYVDTTGIIENSFNIAVKVFYGNMTTDKFVKVTFYDSVDYVLLLGIIGGVIFIIVLIVLLIVTYRLRKIKDDIIKKKRR
jgi:hypothetical protein